MGNEIKMIKKFLEWIGLKEKIHYRSHMPPLFNEPPELPALRGGCNGGSAKGVGETVVSPWRRAVSGASVENRGFSKETPLAERPALRGRIGRAEFTKYDKYSFLGLPLTTKAKTGSWYISVVFGGKNQTIVLAQGRVFDYRRFKEKMGELEENEAGKVREAYAKLHIKFSKNRPPALAGGSRGYIPNIPAC